MENRFKRYYPTIDNRIYSNYIKYDRLKHLVLHEFANTPYANCNHVNIFIDIFEILRGIRYEEIINSNKYALAAGIINMIAHYREYFRSRHNTTSYVYILSGFNDNKYLRLINPAYNSFHSNDDASQEKMDYIQMNIDILNMIIPYIPNTYFKHYEHSPICAGIADIMNYNSTILNDKSPNIIITRDVINFQLVDIGDTHTVIIRPKKSVVGNMNVSSEDASFSINKNSLLSTLVFLRVQKTEEINRDTLNERMRKISNIDPGLYSLFLSMTRIPERRYGTMLSMPTAINILDKILVKDKLEYNGYTMNPMNILKLIEDNYNYKNFNSIEIESRFRTVDARYLLNQLHSIGLENYKFTKDLYNPDLLKQLNEKFFTENPLDLNVL